MFLKKKMSDLIKIWNPDSSFNCASKIYLKPTPWSMCTFYEKGLLLIDIHETVGTGIAVASKRVPDQLLPGRLGDRDVVVLHPATLMWVIDVSPVVACISLAFMNQDCMKPVWNLKQHKEDFKSWLEQLMWLFVLQIWLTTEKCCSLAS